MSTIVRGRVQFPVLLKEEPTLSNQIAMAIDLVAMGRHPLEAMSRAGMEWANDLLTQRVLVKPAGERSEELKLVWHLARQAYFYIEKLERAKGPQAHTSVEPLPAIWFRQTDVAMQNSIPAEWILFGYLTLFFRPPESTGRSDAFQQMRLGEALLHFFDQVEDAEEAGEEGGLYRSLLTYEAFDSRGFRMTRNATGIAGQIRTGFETRVYEAIRTGEVQLPGEALPSGIYKKGRLKRTNRQVIQLADLPSEMSVPGLAMHDRHVRTKHPQAQLAYQVHDSLLKMISQLHEGTEDRSRDRDGYAFYDGYSMDAIADHPFEGLYGSHSARTTAHPSPLLFWASLNALAEVLQILDIEPGEWMSANTKLFRRAYAAWARTYPLTHQWLVENASYWNGERIALGDIKSSVRFKAFRDGIPFYPRTLPEWAQLNKRERLRWEEERKRAHREIMEWVRDELDTVPNSTELVQVLENEVLPQHSLDGSVQTEEVTGIQFLFGAELPPPSMLPTYRVTGRPHEQWSRRAWAPGFIIGPAEEVGEDIALNSIELLIKELRGKPKPYNVLFGFAGSIRTWLDRVVGGGTRGGTKDLKGLLYDGELTTLNDLVLTIRWAGHRARYHHPVPSVPANTDTDGDSGSPPGAGFAFPTALAHLDRPELHTQVGQLHAWLSDPGVIFTHLAPAVLWVHQLCFQQLTGTQYRLFHKEEHLRTAEARYSDLKRQIGTTGLTRADQLRRVGALGSLTRMCFQATVVPEAEQAHEWVPQEWTLERVMAFVNGTKHLATKAMLGALVTPEEFTSLARAIGYPDHAIQLGLLRLGEGMQVNALDPFSFLDAEWQQEEQQVPFKRGLAGHLWNGRVPFMRFLREWNGWYPPLSPDLIRQPDGSFKLHPGLSADVEKIAGQAHDRLKAYIQYRRTHGYLR